MALAQVAVPVPGLGLLTYRVPPGLEVVSGARVVVPVGQRHVTGVVTGVTDADACPDTVRLRDVIDVLDDEAFLPADVVRLALWVADYYMAGPGEAVATALPPRGWLRSDVSLTAAAGAEAGGLTGVPALVFSTVGARGPVLRSHLDRVVRTQVAAGDAEPETAEIRRALRRLIQEGHLLASPVVTGRADASRRRRWVRPTAALIGSDAQPSGRRQAELCALLQQAPEGVDAAALRGRGIGSDVIRRVVGLGLAHVEWRAVERDPFLSGVTGDVVAPGTGGEFLPVTGEQQHVLDALLPCIARARFATALLHGVTGSGKTQVYLRLARATLDAGRTVLLLVPEIALTPVVARLFRQAFGARVAIQHSGLSDGERHDQWHRIRRGEVAVVVGTRSAVFAPLPALGLVIVDEEHDSAYKQEEAPRYNGRDAAVVRGRNADALVVLGSATPSLESYRNASEGRYQWLQMHRRIHDRPLARVEVIDMREVFAAEGPDTVLSRPFVEALGHCLDRGEQAMVLLNRRGYAPSLFCRACGATVDCPNCSVSLTVHRAARSLRCHYCNHAQRLPPRCAACQGEVLEYTGIGTERVEQELIGRFASARVARVDRDTMRRRGAIASVLQRFARRELDVLVGTQMIAKGHDFPQVTLVGVISADIGLGVADFRAAERTFQLLTQVAGRAGRGEASGTALIQTLHPAHYAIVLAGQQDYLGFTVREMEFRERLRYPPWVSMVNIVIRHASGSVAMQDGARLADTLRDARAFAVLGPAPAPLGRLRGESRVQLFLKGRDRAAMRDAVRRALRDWPEVARRTAVDVDPLSLL